MKRILLAGALSLASIPANATTWYMLNFQNLTCHLPPRTIASPLAYETALRELGRFGGTKVYRYDDGTINGVSVTDSSVNLANMFFPSLAGCNAFIEYGLERGLLTKPDELK